MTNDSDREYTTTSGQRFPRSSSVRTESGGQPVDVAIGLGSNLGDRQANLEAAARALAEVLDDVRCSSVYETVPMHVTDQPDFLNACCVGTTCLAPAELLSQLLDIERALGRVADERRYGPRLIDLDILLYGDRVEDTTSLTIPHPRLHERAFALVPLAEVAPNWQHHARERSISELRDAISTDGVRATDGVLEPSGAENGPNEGERG